MSKLFLFDPMRFRKKRVLLLTHAHADVDAVASAGMLFHYFKSFSTPVIGIPDHISLPARKTLEYFSLPFVINPSLAEFDAIILLETSSLERLGTMAGAMEYFFKPVYVLDHHERSNIHIPSLADSFIDPNAVSLTELLYCAFVHQKQKLSKDQCALLALGIMADSASFVHANAFTFQAMHDLVEKSQHSYDELLNLFLGSREISQRISSLKAARSMRLYRAHDYLVVTSLQGLGSGVEDSFIMLGADAVILASTTSQEVILTLRANTLIQSNTGLNLVKDILPILEKQFKGHGGGHSGAVSFSCTSANTTSVLAVALDALLKVIQRTHPDARWKEYNG